MFEIAKNSFYSCPMITCGVVHKLEYFIDGKGNVWLVNDKYWRSPTMLLYLDPSERGVPEYFERDILLDIGMQRSLPPSIFYHNNKSLIYLDCERCKLGPVFVTSTPKK